VYLALPFLRRRRKQKKKALQIFFPIFIIYELHGGDLTIILVNLLSSYTEHLAILPILHSPDLRTTL
jgi:hypothetical protein